MTALQVSTERDRIYNLRRATTHWSWLIIWAGLPTGIGILAVARRLGVENHPLDPFALGTAIGVAAVAITGWFVIHPRIECGYEGLTVVNPWRTHRVAYQRIVGPISVMFADRQQKVLVLILKVEGVRRPVRIWGVDPADGATISRINERIVRGRDGTAERLA